MKRIKEQTILITGATDGLGKSAARALAAKGAKLLLHGRNPEKGEAVLREIKEETGNKAVSYWNADFAVLSDVASLTDRLLRSGEHIDVLINNAGLGSGKRTGAVRELNGDGYELRFTVNYLSHVMMTTRLLPLLRDGGRIVNVSSIGQTDIDFDDVMMERGYGASRAYCQSKLAQIMYTFDLAEKLTDRRIVVNALHPSTYMNTKMVAEHFGEFQSTVEEGTEALLRLAISQELEGVTGEYFNVLEKDRAISQAYDRDARGKLREATARLLRPYSEIE